MSDLETLHWCPVCSRVWDKSHNYCPKCTAFTDKGAQPVMLLMKFAWEFEYDEGFPYNTKVRADPEVPRNYEGLKTIE